MSALPVPVQPTTHDVTIKTTKKLAQAKVMGVPPEEFGIERSARSLASCNYCFHEVVTKTKADWIDEGFDADQIMALTAYTGLSEIETVERDTVSEHLTTNGGTEQNPSTVPIRVTEHYVRMDYEKNGRPSLYQVITGGDQGDILNKDGKPCITKYDAIPFAATTTIPQPHRFFGRSIADLVMPLQREKTAVKRGFLDNMYLHNNARMEISESHAGVNTLDDLLVSRSGAPIRTKMPGGLNPVQVQDITASIYPALQYLDAELESKTGVSKQTQGLDANALQNQSATAVAQVFSSSQMRMKLIARVMAEGVKDLFSLLHGTIRKHGQQAQTVRLRNQWVNVDPRNWKTRNDMTINVGLGNGSKAQQYAQIMGIGQVQKEFLMGGKGHMVGDDKLFNFAGELVKLTGHKNVDKFFDDPSAKDPQTGQLLHPPARPQPDPKVQVAQLQANAKQQEIAANAQVDQAKTQADIIHQQVKAQADIAVAQIKAELDGKLKLMDAFLKAQGMHQDMIQSGREHALDMVQNSQEMQHEREKHNMALQSSAVSMHQGQEKHKQGLELAKQKSKKPKGK